jgi:eukaryotic-like serine/threonine-protein kinase
MKVSGERLGKYEIEALLGAGGHGSVYAARDTVLGRRVAIKLLHPKHTYDVESAARFRSEAEAMARLSHENVVTVHDFLAHGNEWAIVMELCEGGQSLDALIGRDGRLGVERALTIAAAMARGLGHAHARGIVHRDVKPANVLLWPSDEGERVKVTDFGIARLLGGGRHTRDDLTLGTVYYMAPEQANRSDVEAPADVYALGVTLYHMLTGQVPFGGDNPIAVLTAHASEVPRAPSTLAPGIPPAVDALVLSCMAKRPEGRPRDGREVAARILAVSPGPAVSPAEQPGPTGSQPSAADAQVSRTRDARTALWIGVGTVLLLGVVCMVSGIIACVSCGP